MPREMWESSRAVGTSVGVVCTEVVRDDFVSSGGALQREPHRSNPMTILLQPFMHASMKVCTLEAERPKSAGTCIPLYTGIVSREEKTGRNPVARSQAPLVVEYRLAIRQVIHEAIHRLLSSPTLSRPSLQAEFHPHAQVCVHKKFDRVQWYCR